MANIDNVIARSRQPGGFQERKRFTVARQRAIRKMRQFALADPHYYVLELIQAAVANGATHVDLRIDKKSFGLSYVGGGFTQEELAQLFDFLFASKKDFAHGDIRQLALGINALMIMEPKRIIIESGDGTMGGTTRISIKGGENTVDVGTPQESLRGTFVRAEGLRRSKMKGKSNLKSTGYGPAETMAIEQRCLAAPVPILVNDHPVFGYSSVRTPVLFGYDNVVTFDEGDLYGSIGLAMQTHNEMFKLLTWGTWIQSIEHDLADTRRLGGIVAFDRLNKTADHSGIVRDERLAQMWARLQPYAHKVTSGQTGRAVFQIAPLGEDLLEPRELRQMLRDTGNAVMVPESVEPNTSRGDLAAEIGRVLEAPVLTVPDDEIQTLRNLAGSDVRLLKPDLDHPEELAFFKQPKAKPPSRPWLIGPSDIEPIGVDEFVDLLHSEQIIPHDVGEGRLQERLGGSGEVTGTVYTRAEANGGDEDDRRELWVRVRTVDRIVWQGPITSAFPGHVLDVEVPAVSPSALRRPMVDGDADASFAWLVAEVMARHAVDDLETAAQRALDSLVQVDIEPGSPAARIALAALVRSSVKRLRTQPDQGAQMVRFSMVDAGAKLDLLDVPVFHTLDGTPTTMRDLEFMMEDTDGLIYGVVPEVEPDLDGLDTSLVLDLDLETERLLMSIVGEGAYVRIDRRDELASEGIWRVRDVAVGLQEYPDGPLLVEKPPGADGGPSEPQFKEPQLESMVEQLIRVFGGASPRGDGEEFRREAVRHLQHFVCRRALDEPDKPTYGVENLGLFLDGTGQAVSFEEVKRGFDQHGRLVMIDGRSSDVCELGSLGERRQRDRHDDGPPAMLLMNTWVLGLLQPFGNLVGAFDFDLTDAEAAEVAFTPETAFVAGAEVAGDQLSGRLGLPEEPVDDPTIAVVSADKRKVYQLRQPALVFGVVGLIRVESGEVEARWDEVYAAANRAARQTLGLLIDELAEMDHDSARFERVLQVLFDYAGRHLRMTRRPDQSVHAEISDTLAQRILDIPIFATTRGVPVSAQRLINEFCVEQTRQRRIGGASHIVLADDVPQVLLDWLDRHLSPTNVVRPAAESAKRAVSEQIDAPTDTLDNQSLERLIEHWLERLRPDLYAEQMAEDAAGQPIVDPVRKQLAAGAEDPHAGLGDNALEMVRSFQARVLLLDPTDEAARSNRSVRVQYLIEDMSADELFVYHTGRPPLLVVNQLHPVVERARRDGAHDPKELAWLLLAAYSHINALLEPVTNEHEFAFQRRMGRALQEDELSATIPQV